MKRTMRKAMMGAILACFLLQPRADARADGGPQPRTETLAAQTILLTIKASPTAQLHTTLALCPKDRSASLLARAERESDGGALPVSDAYVTIPDGDNSRIFVVDAGGDLHAADGGRIRLTPGGRARLVAYIRMLRSMHYGQPVPWDKADALIPMKQTVTVIDLEKGLSFRAQRRAGKHHADVQPVSKRDTLIMKQMYDGNWSWRRRAILVKTNGNVLAASMHGMPHGGDGIPDNGFRGHFCIHFLNSSTHGSGHVDPDHQYMIRKAAGALPVNAAGTNPYELVETWLLAVRAKDAQTIGMLAAAYGEAGELQALAADRQTAVGHISFPGAIHTDTAGMLAVDIPAQVGLLGAQGGRSSHTFVFQLRRAALTDPWDIVGVHRR